MSDNFIHIDTAKRLGSQLRNVVESTRGVLDALNKLKTIMDQQTDGATYTTIETEFGIPTGKGGTVYNLVAGSYAAVNVSAILQYISYLG